MQVAIMITQYRYSCFAYNKLNAAVVAMMVLLGPTSSDLTDFQHLIFPAQFVSRTAEIHHQESEFQ